MVKVQIFGEQAETVWNQLAQRGIHGTEVDSGDSTPFYEVTEQEAETVRRVAADYGVDPSDLIIRQ